MSNVQLLKFINGVSSKSVASNPEKYLNQWSSWLATQNWATVNSVNDDFSNKLLQLHKAAVNELVKTKATLAVSSKAKSNTKNLSGSGNYVAEIWASESAQEPEYRKRAKHGVAAQDWGFAKLADVGGNSWFLKVIYPDGKVSIFNRNKAIAHAWGKRKPTVAYKKVGVSSTKWEMRCRNTRVCFSSI